MQATNPTPRNTALRSLSILAVVLIAAAAACSKGGATTASAASASAQSQLPMPPATGSAIAGGAHFTLASIAGRALAWGGNTSGEVGDGTTTQRASPVAVVGLPAPVVALATGVNHSLVVTTEGTLYAWGHNASGQLGDGTKKDRSQPAPVSGLHDVRAVAAGDGFSMALEADGSVFAWGNNQSGQLGDGKAPQDHSTPEVVRGLGAGSGVVAIAAGSSFAIVRKADGSVWEWGNGTSGQLGDGANSKLSAPTQVQGLGPGSGVIAVAGGGAHVLALKSDGTVLAWGHNQSGQLGDGTAPNDHSTPVGVAGLGPGSGIVAIAAGDSFSLAAKGDGSVLAWGNNKTGELGDGTSPQDHSTPVAVPPFTTSGPLRSLAAGGSHGLAITADNQVWAWGNNSAGQLGDGTAPTDQHTPVQVPVS
jgi:alpha-tubulin suppressor-like RCC1 family protein